MEMTKNISISVLMRFIIFMKLKEKVQNITVISRNVRFKIYDSHEYCRKVEPIIRLIINSTGNWVTLHTDNLISYR
jgi:hypothetical protein